MDRLPSVLSDYGNQENNRRNITGVRWTQAESGLLHDGGGARIHMYDCITCDYVAVCVFACRYMVIVHPLRPRIVSGIVLAVIFVIWLTSAAIALPSLIYGNTYTIEYCQGSRVICYLEWPDGNYGLIDFLCVAFGCFFFTRRLCSLYEKKEK